MYIIHTTSIHQHNKQKYNNNTTDKKLLCIRNTIAIYKTRILQQCNCNTTTKQQYANIKTFHQQYIQLMQPHLNTNTEKKIQQHQTTNTDTIAIKQHNTAYKQKKEKKITEANFNRKFSPQPLTEMSDTNLFWNLALTPN